jgi:hypothetical protein
MVAERDCKIYYSENIKETWPSTGGYVKGLKTTRQKDGILGTRSNTKVLGAVGKHRLLVACSTTWQELIYRSRSGYLTYCSSSRSEEPTGKVSLLSLSPRVLPLILDSRSLVSRILYLQLGPLTTPNWPSKCCKQFLPSFRPSRLAIAVCTIQESCMQGVPNESDRRRL